MSEPTICFRLGRYERLRKLLVDKIDEGNKVEDDLDDETSLLERSAVEDEVAEWRLLLKELDAACDPKHRARVLGQIH